MKITELITRLQDIQAKHGDVDILGWDDGDYTPVGEIVVEQPEGWRNPQKVFHGPIPAKVAQIRPWVQDMGTQQEKVPGDTILAGMAKIEEAQRAARVTGQQPVYSPTHQCSLHPPVDTTK